MAELAAMGAVNLWCAVAALKAQTSAMSQRITSVEANAERAHDRIDTILVSER